jgi:predicted small secreted protein
MKKTILLLLTTLALNSCNKDDDKPKDPIDELPIATQNGKNTFGCLINGVPFVVKNTSMQTAIYQGGILQISGGIDNSNMDKQISINISAPINLNVPYDLTLIPSNLAIFVNNGEGCYYDYNNTISGTLLLTNLDQINFIVSGTFEFSTVTGNCENINITNGRFDLQYIP